MILVINQIANPSSFFYFTTKFKQLKQQFSKLYVTQLFTRKILCYE